MCICCKCTCIATAACNGPNEAFRQLTRGFQLVLPSAGLSASVAQRRAFSQCTAVGLEGNRLEGHPQGREPEGSDGRRGGGSARPRRWPGRFASSASSAKGQGQGEGEGEGHPCGRDRRTPCGARSHELQIRLRREVLPHLLRRLLTPVRTPPCLREMPHRWPHRLLLVHIPPPAQIPVAGGRLHPRLHHQGSFSS